MAYKVLDLFKDLPGTNCGECGRSGCFAFATAVYLEGAPLSGCPHLSPEALREMAARLEEGRARGEGRRPEASEQALGHLRSVMAERDLREVAERCGARYEAGPPEAVEVTFLGVPHRVLRDDVRALEGPEPTVWVKIFLLIYATRATGEPPEGRWVSYRELPNTVSKSRSFEACAERIARAFEGRPGDLEGAASRLGGERVPHGSAPWAYRFRALPRVEILLLFWDRDEEFPARAMILLDGGVLGYLDQEALVFLAEAFAQRMLGEGLEGVIP